MDKTIFHSIVPKTPLTNPIKQNINQSQAKNPFSMHLQNAIEASSSLSISKHAEDRLKERNIRISEEKWGQIEQKVLTAKKMGVNESLVLLKDAALIVSAKNNKVITAMNRQEAASQIFTNINGTILIDS